MSDSVDQAQAAAAEAAKRALAQQKGNGVDSKAEGTKVANVHSKAGTMSATGKGAESTAENAQGGDVAVSEGGAANVSNKAGSLIARAGKAAANKQGGGVTL